MRRNIFILFLFIISSKYAFVQVPVFIRYPDILNANDYTSNGYLYFDSSYYILRDYSQMSFVQEYSLTGKEGRQVYLFDSTFQWKSYQTCKQISPNRIIMLGTSKKAVWGKSPRGLMGVFDSTFKIQFDTSYQIHYNSFFSSIISDYAPHQYIFLCSYCLNATCDSTGMAVIRIDSNGHILQIKELNNSPYGEFMQSIIPTQDSNFVLCGVSSRLSKNASRPNFMMYKLDRDFNILWSKDLGDRRYDQSVNNRDNNLIELRRNVFVMTGHEDLVNPFYLAGKIIIYDSNLDSTKVFAFPLNEFFLNTVYRINDFAFNILNNVDNPIAKRSKLRIIRFENNSISFKKEIILDESKFKTIDGINHNGMYKTPDGGFIIPGWGFGPQLSNSALGFVVKTDSCGYTEGDTCTVRMKVNNLLYNTLTTSVLEQASQYCGVKWNIGDSVYWSPTAIHTFKKKGLYEVKLLGWAADRVDSTSLWVSIDSIWIAPPKDTTKNNIQSYSHFSHTLSLYPNPASDFIEIDWKIEMNYNTSIDIYNVGGVLVKSIELPNHSTNARIPIQELASGIYQVIWRDKGEVREMKRMVKE